MLFDLPLRFAARSVDLLALFWFFSMPVVGA